MAKRSAKDYEEMSRAVEAGEYTVRGPMELGATLRMGRPTKGTPSEGKTPALPVRLPAAIRIEMRHRVKNHEADSESELVRRALVEYFEHHPARRR
ncbi:hypothetical protein [Mycobacterium gastri]|nr:hypothetical protein [Mycobacterium gastri]ETW26217.1 hypothetical protein MGAST_28820 [Mycobacterium gastri 'Wayne']